MADDNTTLRVLGIAGSLRAGSFNRALLRAAQELAPDGMEIRAFDIGIKPMPDDPWARGKCPMKELQYMALGIPTVCSAVGTSAEAIRDGENGFLANSARQWVERLTRLVDDSALRRKIGLAGRQTVEERYSMRVCATQFAEAIRSVVEDGHGR